MTLPTAMQTVVRTALREARGAEAARQHIACAMEMLEGLPASNPVVVQVRAALDHLLGADDAHTEADQRIGDHK